MKKIFVLAIILTGFSACSHHMYNSYSAGKDNVAFITVLTAGQSYEGVSVNVDGQDFPIEKVYQVKATHKAHPIITTPGKHYIKVISKGKTLLVEQVMIGLQETKKIVLQ